MYAVMYKWKLKGGCEDEFVAAWAEVTEEIRGRWGTGGSRLHRTEDGLWVAYAQWPSCAAWDAAFQTPPKPSAPRQKMAECIAASETVFRMEVVCDLLGPPSGGTPGP